MYAPIVLRLKTYQIELSQPAKAYCEHVLACPVLQNWVTQALTETDIIEQDEVGDEVGIDA